MHVASLGPLGTHQAIAVAWGVGAKQLGIYFKLSRAQNLMEEECSCKCRCGSAFAAAVASCGNGGGNEDEVGDAQAMRSLAWSAVALRFCRFCCVCVRLDDMRAFVFTTREKMVPA